MTGKTLAAIDIGTTAISVLAAEAMEKGVRILGAATAPSRGIRKGVVINTGEAADSIRDAVIEAESEAGRKIASAVVNIGGQHIKGFLSRGLIGLDSREISASDRLRAIDAAKTVYIPLDRETIHIIPAGFVLDGKGGIADPTGMSGVRLESIVHILTAYTPSVQKLAKACEEAGIEILDAVFGPAATAAAVITPDEIRQGALLLDIGGGTTDIAFFRDKAMVHASVVGIGGLHITNDLAVGLKVTLEEADRIKKAVGLYPARPAASDDRIEIMGRDGQPRTVSRHMVTSIIEPRCEELFEQVRDEVRAFGEDCLSARSLILTGGTALLGGITGLAASIMFMPARVGLPRAMAGMKNILRTPAYAAVAGLVAYAVQRQEGAALLRDTTDNVLARVTEKIKNAFGYKDFLETDQNNKKGVSYV